VLTPGPADLQAMGGNLMNPRRRIQVLDTALATSSGVLDAAVMAGRSAA
jgi:NTE family protein